MATKINYQFATLAEVRHLPLVWVQVKGWKQCFELRAGDHLVAVMQWDGVFKSSATVESAEGVWHLARHGFFKMHTDLKVHQQMEPTLILNNRWNGGDLTLPDGRALQWRGKNFWGTKYAFIDEATDRALITYHYRGFLKYNADLTLDPEAESLPHLTMLLSLGWYLIVLQIMDSAAASSGAMVATMG